MNLTEPGELAVRKWISSGRLARPEGLEPPAYWFEANRSIQLSYGRGSGDRDLMVSSRVPR